jgi:hypothetical protein
MKNKSSYISKEVSNIGSPITGRPDSVLYNEFFKSPLGKWKLESRLTLNCIRIEFFENDRFSLILQGSSENMKAFIVAGYFNQYKWVAKYFKMYFPETEQNTSLGGKLEYRYESCSYLDKERNELQLRFQAHIIPPRDSSRRSW